MDLKSLRKGWLGKRMNISIQSERKKKRKEKGKTDVKTHGFKVEKMMILCINVENVRFSPAAE